MLLRIYHKMPIRIQNFLLSIYGYKLKIFRFNARFYKYVSNVRKRSYYTKDEFTSFQNSKLKSIITHAYNNVPYYKKMMRDLNIKPEMINTVEDLKLFPLITKSDIRQNASAFKAKNKLFVIKNPTGGTTGSPLIMKTTHQELSYSAALYEVREKEQFGVFTGEKTATFLGKQIVDPKNSTLPYWRSCKSLNQTMYSVYHMNKQTIQYYIENLRADTPKYITGYVTPVYQIAQFIVSNKLPPISIKAVFLSSETLHSWQQAIIEEAFLCKVCNGYSQSENVAFISSCINGKLHVNPDYGVIEFVKVEGSEYYEIVGTTLFNYSMPLIRYKTGDYVLFERSDTCECSLPLYPIVREIIGRDDSIIKSPSGKIISSAAISLVFQFFPEIYECQIIQESISDLAVSISSNRPLKDRYKTDFIKKLENVIGNEFNIKLFEVGEIPKTSSGKSKLIISKL